VRRSIISRRVDEAGVCRDSFAEQFVALAKRVEFTLLPPEHVRELREVFLEVCALLFEGSEAFFRHAFSSA
jgi:hypothetical protein